MFQSRSLTTRGRGPIAIRTTPFLMKTCNTRSPYFFKHHHHLIGLLPARGATATATATTLLPLTNPISCHRLAAEAEAEAAAQSLPSSTSPMISPNNQKKKKMNIEFLEENIEKVIYRCRFLAILGVFGSLVGSFLCFIKGCTFVVSSFMEYFLNRGKVILLLVEAIGTVMLVFGMGLYELFISNLDAAKTRSGEKAPHRSNLFGLFPLKERPRWLEIKTVNELKTKLGHVIVMLLLIGFFEKSKTAVIHSSADLLCFSACVLLCSGCLYLLSKLSD